MKKIFLKNTCDLHAQALYGPSRNVDAVVAEVHINPEQEHEKEL